ncbi:hypothetical protein L2E82_15045 [Cichorium intybus]|uniref:Uncharacterized protein n=1 Tax=Cichorium intybus TaxID=13427 RepID=A0ACB9F162_CICIN|nr:hypothetical protein L2E82_15045 [Cichorium intybus]
MGISFSFLFNFLVTYLMYSFINEIYNRIDIKLCCIYLADFLIDDRSYNENEHINIPGNKQGILDADTKSTARRMQQDCSKGMAVGGQKEVTKKLGPIQDDKGLEKRVNTKNSNRNFWSEKGEDEGGR